MRRRGCSARHQEFADFLLDIGIGKDQSTDDVLLPSSFFHRGTLDSALQWIFPRLSDGFFYVNSAIVTPFNKDATYLNHYALNMLPQHEIPSSFSAESVQDKDSDSFYPTEFLNSLNPPGLPPHELKMKLGCPLMLCWTLNAVEGLCIGTSILCRKSVWYHVDVRSLTTWVWFQTWILTWTPSGCWKGYQVVVSDMGWGQ